MKYIGHSNGYEIYMDDHKYYYYYDRKGDKVPNQTNSEGKRTHRATYARDKRNGGFNIRVVGPQANEFAGFNVPVETKSGEEHTEKLIGLLWTGPDVDPETKESTGRKAALYSFEARPREVIEPSF